MATEYIKPKTNIPLQIHFLRDDCVWSNHPEYGESYAHLIEAAEAGVITKGSLRATPKLHEALLAAGAGKGAVIELIKTEVAQPGTRSRIDWVCKNLRTTATPGFRLKDWDGHPVTPSASPSASPSPSTTGPLSVFDGAPTPLKPPPAPHAPTTAFQPPAPPPSLADLVALYRECLEGARWAWGTDATPDQLQAGTACLFIQATRLGLKPSPPPNGMNGLPEEVPQELVAPGSTGDDLLPF